MRDKIRDYVEQKLVSEQKHPRLDLWIYNYTKKCQYDARWDDVTMACRGLILDGNGNVVARPFRKFFNYGEYQGELPAEGFEVTEKMDGSLGILYLEGGLPKLATRGSFVSEQAIKGTEILQRKFRNYDFDKNLTYLFEIIYPGNRIVVDYKGVEDVILLAVVETSTGKELPLEQFREFTRVRKFDGVKDISKLKERQEDNREGYVIRFESGLRLKIKFDEYVRLHRLVTETNSKRVWEFLKDNLPVDELIERVPDEFYSWVKRTIKGLQDEYAVIEAEAKKEFEKINHIPSRKEFAMEAQKHRLKSLLFLMRDGRDYSGIIWMMIKPKAEKPFKEEL